ncbi:MAG: restriction endonuclease subunit S [Gracilimonas sp.]|uniref:restriction endonuclease subunit S n=1 Tax=Gracilimonas sp. TaxID=1974203 RepID=UPI001B159ADC|nr:restriction endonuclease subunit S [Gracilimonas sp.]MBO6585319.1 restriction endonuclease subunit S [Gracilimonas sp.]MBO6616315.1 restriction endonuclease subunit S [Gracilimonas sp.]
MSKENKLTPELRFPEFDKDGNWKLAPFNKLYSLKITNSFSRNKLNLETGSVKNIHYGDIHTQFSTLFDITKEKVPFINPDVSIEGIDQENYCSEGDIIMADASEDLDDIGKSIEIVNLNNEKLLSGLHTLQARQIKPNFIIGFGGYLFKSAAIRKQIKRQAQGAKVLGISKGRISEINVYYPEKKEEQQKIVDCLSSLDELITAHKNKLDSLKDHKKSLLQNFFPHDKRKKPKYRFPEFEKEGDWEMGKFSKYIKLDRGSSPRPIREYRTKSDDGVNWIKIGDTGADDDFKISSVEEKITQKGAEKSRRVSKGELILANSMSYGKTYEIDIDGCIYDGWFVLREYEESFDKQFLLQLLNSDYMQYQYEKYAAGGIVKNISSKIVYNTVLPRPSLDEQKKIASCLSECDELIHAEKDKLEELELHKKGLMQGLFPKISN